MSGQEDMVLKTMWIKRDYAWDDPPELLVAWDEYAVEINPDGFRKHCDYELEALGSDREKATVRYVDIHVFRKTIEDAFEPAKVRHLFAEDVTDR